VQPATPAPASNNRGLAIASLILGILSLCGSISLFCTTPLALVGIVLGALGIKSTARSMAIAGIVLSVVGLIMAVIIRFVFRVGANSFITNWQNRILNGGQ
jgi:hypothetical protein